MKAVARTGALWRDFRADLMRFGGGKYEFDVRRWLFEGFQQDGRRPPKKLARRSIELGGRPADVPEHVLVTIKGRRRRRTAVRCPI